MRWLVVVVSALSFCACGNGATETPGVGELIGRVELTDGFPAAGAVVQVEGTPLGAFVDRDGNYRIPEMPPGAWALKVTPTGDLADYGSRKILAATNQGETTTLDIMMYNPGVVGGRLLPPDAADAPPVFVAISELGLAAAPTASAGYLLTGVAPGAHKVTLVVGEGSVERTNVSVEPQSVIECDFDLQDLITGLGTIVGYARDGKNSASGVTVELVNSFDGSVVASAVAGGRSDGFDFSFDVKPGAYMIRASKDGGASGLHPPVVVATDGMVEVRVAIPGKKTGNDPDGDGNLNGHDDFPNHFGLYGDADGDGVPDGWDLDDDGDQVVDNSPPTTDTDEDGIPDVADNCPATPNPNQNDTDHDGQGDVCDSNGTIVTRSMIAGEVRSSHQSVCGSGATLDTMFQISLTNSCNYDRAFFMIRDIPVPAGATIRSAYVTLEDLAGSGAPFQATLKSQRTFGTINLPDSASAAENSWNEYDSITFFTEDRRGQANNIDIKSLLQNAVNDYYWDFGENSFLFMVGTEEPNAEAYYRANAKITVSYTP